MQRSKVASALVTLSAVTVVANALVRQDHHRGVKFSRAREKFPAHRTVGRMSKCL